MELVYGYLVVMLIFHSMDLGSFLEKANGSPEKRVTAGIGIFLIIWCLMAFYNLLNRGI